MVIRTLWSPPEKRVERHFQEPTEQDPITVTSPTASTKIPAETWGGKIHSTSTLFMKSNQPIRANVTL